MFSGVIKKMISIHDDPIRYMLDFENDLLFINQFIGKNINLKKTGYCCLSCSENIEIFANGFCKKCFFESPMSGDWVMKPELSKAHLGIEDRDLEYEKQIQIQDHIVYLSKTSETKVGVTRSNNKTTRWIDQGAIEAIELAISALKEELETEDAGKIKSGIQNVTEAAMKLGEAIYKASQEDGENSDKEPGSADFDDNIVDADFEDLDDEQRS